ncbi:succinylglutamate desuccinylase [Desulfuromonas versatilis]|uniref:Succinylglutamate desuccinylase n=1 Tax=Desulfuromonas versatilis TaxID=2802975 RepID=A0ABN6E2L1_9BACT|nr:succinylglutamate desuccinylase/aspartoacylase family protein [Desulfuromonas versatilis]BCR06588.1 succinylglutamate desuccinylase [Desulfuromonas versatilis]
MREAITIGGRQVQPGRREIIDLPMARLYTHTEMMMPVHVAHGRREGPRLFISGALHGDEIIGVEIIRRLLKLKALQRLRGTLIAIPVVNAFGFINRTRYLPDRRDLNRSFPGSSKGSLSSRLARLFMDEIVAHCTHGIDLHSGSNFRSNLPQIRACLDDPETRRLATAFGAPVIIDARLRDGSLREAVMEKGLPMLLYESGEALRFNEVAVKTGLRGILAVMREIGMLGGQPRRKPQAEPLVAQGTTWVRAPKSGITIFRCELGSRVNKGEVLGVIGDPFGNNEEQVRAPLTGVVIGRLNLPLVHAGDALFNIASFDRPHTGDLTMEALASHLGSEDFEAEETL